MGNIPITSHYYVCVLHGGCATPMGNWYEVEENHEMNSRHAPHCSAMAVLLICCTCAHGDTVYLKNGGKLEGTVKELDDRLVVTHRFGKVTVSKKDVLRVHKKKTVEEEYRERAAKLKGDDAEGHYQLGLWLASRRRDRLAQKLYEKAICIDRDHQGARQALGHVFHEGAWRTGDEAARLKGLVKHGHKWVTRAKALRLEQAEAKERFEKELRAKLNRGIRKVTSRNAEVRREGLEELLAIAEEYNCPALRGYAEKLFKLRRGVGGRRVTMEIKLDETAVTGMDRFQLQSLVDGRTVSHTLQLPRYRATSIRTTVVAP